MNSRWRKGNDLSEAGVFFRLGALRAPSMSEERILIALGTYLPTQSLALASSRHGLGTYLSQYEEE